MDSKCSLKDEHLDQFIEGICIDGNCKAQYRVLCNICRWQDHKQCSQSQILNHKELLTKLQNTMQSFDDRGRQEIHGILKITDPQKADQKLVNSTDDAKMDIAIIIQKLANIPFTTKIWMKCYQLLNLELSEPSIGKKQQDMNQDNLEIKLTQDNNLESSIQNQIQVASSNTWFKIPHDIYSIDCSPSESTIVCGTDKIIFTFDYMRQKQIGKTIKGHKEEVLSVKYAANGQIIASGSSDFTIRIWSAKKKQQIGKPFVAHKGTVMSISFSADSQYLISGSYDKTLRQWHVKQQKQVNRWIKSRDLISFVSYSPNRSQILCAYLSGYINIWDSRRTKLLKKFVGHKSTNYKAAYSFDGRYIVSGAQDKIIKLWNACTSKQIGNDLIGHEHYITQVSFSNNAKLILSASYDRTVRLWNSATQTQVCILCTHEQAVTMAIFSKNSSIVASGDIDSNFCISNITSE